MPTVLFTLAVLWGLRYLIGRRTAAALAASFLLFSLVSRTLSLAYVDLAGPLYSDQLGRMVGGAPTMPLFAASVLLLMATLAYVFRPTILAQVRIPTRPASWRTDLPGNALFAFSLAFVVSLYGDMVGRGVVPLLAGMDRLEYNTSIAGPLHEWLGQMGFLLASMLGAGFCMPRLQGREFSFRFLALYLLILIYFALTGNRFSAFYSFTSFFVLPLAAVPAMASVGLMPPPPVRTHWKRFFYSKTALFIALSLGSLGIVILLLQSIINVRAYDDPVDQLIQRALIQPVELWCATWDNLDRYWSGSFDEAWADLFTNSLDPTRNTSMQMLMLRNLGTDRTQELLDMGQQYTGGYPEVLFEFLGPLLALPAALAFSIPTALLLRMSVLALCERRLLTVLMSIYVFYGFSLLFIGGMLNFLVVWTYWVKVAVLFVVYLLERGLYAFSRRSIRSNP